LGRAGVRAEQVELRHDALEDPEIADYGQTVVLVLGEEPLELVDRRHG
jgi:hypothetical protein